MLPHHASTRTPLVPPREISVSPEKQSPATPMHGAKPAPFCPPPPRAGSGQGRGGSWLWCAGTRRDMGGGWTKSYSTWINLSARAALSYPAEGVPSDRGRRQSGRRRDRRGGETDKNHVSLTRSGLSLEAGERGVRPENQRTSRRGPGGRAKPELAPSWRGTCVSGQVGLPFREAAGWGGGSEGREWNILTWNKYRGFGDTWVGAPSGSWRGEASGAPLPPLLPSLKTGWGPGSRL